MPQRWVEHNARTNHVLHTEKEADACQADTHRSRLKWLQSGLKKRLLFLCVQKWYVRCVRLFSFYLSICLLTWDVVIFAESKHVVTT